MKEPLVFIITALAVYRATRFVIQDELVSPLRNRLWKKFPPETNKLAISSHVCGV